MSDPVDLFDLTVLERGPLARFPAGARGRVAAVFDKTFYVQFTGHVICVGAIDLVPSPLNTRTSAPAATRWAASGVRRDDSVRVDGDVVRLGQRIRLRTAGAAEWVPPRLPEPPRPAVVAQGLSAFRAAARARIPADGLGGLIAGGEGPATLIVAAAPAVAEIRQWLCDPQQNPVGPASAFHRLLGLGPGLTPAGDDFVGGMMIALQALGRHRQSRRIWSLCRDHPALAENAISHAHVRAASQGLAADPVHGALNAVMNGHAGTMAARMDDLDGLGHTSGWDAMAGVVAVIDDWCRAECTRRADAASELGKFPFAPTPADMSGSDHPDGGLGGL